MLSTQNAPQLTVKSVSFQVIFLGIVGFWFNQFCLRTYAKHMGTEAEMPMKIGIIIVYIVGFQLPITLWTIGFIQGLVESTLY